MAPISNLPQELIRKEKRRDHFLEHMMRRTLHLMEVLIATVTLILLLGALVTELGEVYAHPELLGDVGHILHSLLTIVVGLEFVRMLIDTTPANILEVLTVAITRHVVLSHDDPWSNMACIACIAGLFAIRRFLIPRAELAEDLVEDLVEE